MSRTWPLPSPHAAIEPNVHWPDVKWIGRSDPSPIFVAATVLLLLPPVAVATVTDAKSLRQPRVGLPPSRSPWRRSGRWMAIGPQRWLATRRIRLPYNRLRFVMDEGPPVPSQSVARKVPVTAVRTRLRVSEPPALPGIPAGVPTWRDERSPALGRLDRRGPGIGLTLLWDIVPAGGCRRPFHPH